MRDVNSEQRTCEGKQFHSTWWWDRQPDQQSQQQSPQPMQDTSLQVNCLHLRLLIQSIRNGRFYCRRNNVEVQHEKSRASFESTRSQLQTCLNPGLYH